MKEYGIGVDGVDWKIPGGINVLVTGPPLSGKDLIAKRFSHQALEDGGATVYVSTTDGAKEVIEWFVGNGASIDEQSFGVVDCVTKGQDLEEPSNDGFVKYASSPGDLTDIGVRVSDFLEKFYVENNKGRIRLVIHTISVMVMYSNLETVFRFLHTFSGRIKSIGGVGLFVLEEGSHEEKTVKTLKQLVDSSFETRDTEDGKQMRYRGRGLSFGWRNYTINEENIQLEEA